MRHFGHGKSIEEIIELASTVISFIHQNSPQTELRFSTEILFTVPSRFLRVYLAINRLEMVDRFGVADTVGIATPNQVFNLVKIIRQSTNKKLQRYSKNYTTRNAFSWVMLDFMFLIITKRKYSCLIYESLSVGSDKTGVNIPFNHCIVGSAAFSHKLAFILKPC